MTPLLLAILLFAVGSVLLVAEFVIPAHGVTAGLGLLSLIAGVIACFFVGEWLGVTVLALAATGGPLAAVGLAKIFPETRLGRRLVLPPARETPAATPAAAAPVRLGQLGVTVSALRPSGVCEFRDLRADAGATGDPGTIRVQAVSDFGPVAPGRAVRVVCFADGRATVRAV